MVSGQSHVLAATAIFILLFAAIAMKRPLLLFDSDGRVRPFGFRNGESVFSLHTIVVLLAIIVYLTTGLKQ